MAQPQGSLQNLPRPESLMSAVKDSKTLASALVQLFNNWYLLLQQATAVIINTVYETAQGFVRVGIGINSGTPRIVLENNGVVWEIDNEQATAQALRFFRPNTEVARLTADANIADGATALLIRRNVTGTYSLQQVTMGAADSGGVGFKLLRVPN